MTLHERNKAQCARFWEIEAGRDGRLSDEALDALTRHVALCAECRAQSDYVKGLGRLMRELDAPVFDDVAVRRLRQKVLASVDADLAGRSLPPTAQKRTRFAVPAFAFAAIAIFTLVELPWARVPPVTIVPKTTVVALNEGGARWSQRTDGEIERVELNEGALRLKVQKTLGGKRVVVRVPDGEIEDLGTIFHVIVARGQTQRVGVDEGRVTIRLTNATPITISSGESWERPEEAPLVPITPTLIQPLPAPSSLPVALSRSRANHPALRPEVSAAAMPAPPASAVREDAAYLEAIGLMRAGRNAEAKAAARDYLRNFPNGFRREEMGRIAE